MYYVYLLECSDGTYYTGYTSDVLRRVKEHDEGRGAKYTRGRTPVRLIGVREFETQKKAMRMERRVKRLSRQDKIKFFK